MVEYESLAIKQSKKLERNLCFFGEGGKQIGKLYWENELKFKGDAEESAKIFIKWLKELWNL